MTEETVKEKIDFDSLSIDESAEKVRIQKSSNTEDNFQVTLSGRDGNFDADPTDNFENIYVAGTVGIGVASPSEKLEVSGIIKAIAFVGDGSEITALDGKNITSGTIEDSRIPSTISRENRFDPTNGHKHTGTAGDGPIISHSKLDEVLSANLDSSDTALTKHVSDALAKNWQDHVTTKSGNPHGTTAANVGALPISGGTINGTLQVNGNIETTGAVDGVEISNCFDPSRGHKHTGAAGEGPKISHSNLGDIIPANTGSTDTTSTKHVSDALTKGWQDHVTIKSGNPHGTTATNVGALSISGGTINGTLQVKGNLGIEGNVGIGTTNPADKLDVRGNVYFGTGENNQNNKVVIRGPNSPGGPESSQDLSYEFVNAGSAKIRAYRGGEWDTHIQFLTSALKNKGGVPKVQMHINGDGNVGIGTDTPSGKLDVRGSIYAGNSDIYFTKVDHNHTGIGNTAGLAAIENAADYGALMILGRSGTPKGRNVRLWDYLQVNGSMDITGNVGVGTTNPGEKLDVFGTIRLYGKNAFQGGDSYLRINQDNAFPGGTHFNYRANFHRGITTGGWWDVEPGVGNLLVQGNVGIGTTYPGARLHVEATDKPTIMAQGCFGGLVSGSSGGHGIFGTNIYIDSNNQLKTAGKHDANYGYAGMHASWGSIRFYAASGNTAENGIISPSTQLIISPNEIKHFVKCSQASSRELKKDIRDLSIKEASKVLESLNPVTFVMKNDREETLQVGFIAEEAPDLAATADRKGIVNNNIVAVLTKVIKEQQKEIKALIDDVKTLKINSGGIIS